MDKSCPHVIIIAFDIFLRCRQITQFFYWRWLQSKTNVFVFVLFHYQNWLTKSCSLFHVELLNFSHDFRQIMSPFKDSACSLLELYFRHVLRFQISWLTCQTNILIYLVLCSAFLVSISWYLKSHSAYKTIDYSAETTMISLSSLSSFFFFFDIFFRGIYFWFVFETGSYSWLLTFEF